MQMLIEHFVSISGEPDQMPRFVVSDLGLHCLPMSHKKVARLIWVNVLNNVMAFALTGCFCTQCENCTHFFK